MEGAMVIKATSTKFSVPTEEYELQGDSQEIA
jgi:hypothetical protein